MAHSSSHSHSGDHGNPGHILPFKLYATVFAILLVLTVITVAASRVDFGPMNFVVAMLIASVKAGIVALFFMHLKYENPLVWLYVLFPVVLVGIMLGGLFTDNPYRNEPKIHSDEKQPTATKAGHH
jgi:cytochrome c oxidase subunit IV